MPFPDEFEVFNEDDMPNNSDVVFILSHYLTSLKNSDVTILFTTNMNGVGLLIMSHQTIKRTHRL